jgi:hypothetical protein
MIRIEERFENGIKHQPDRYIAVRDVNNKICEFHDKDSGVVWIKTGKDSWSWIS